MKIEIIEMGKETKISLTTNSNKNVTINVSGQKIIETLKEWIKDYDSALSNSSQAR